MKKLSIKLIFTYCLSCMAGNSILAEPELDLTTNATSYSLGQEKIASYLNDKRKVNYIKEFTSYQNPDKVINIRENNAPIVIYESRKEDSRFYPEIISNIVDFFSSVETISPEELKHKSRLKILELSNDAFKLYFGGCWVVRLNANFNLNSGNTSLSYGQAFFSGISFIKFNLAEANLRFYLEYINIFSGGNITGRQISTLYLEMPFTLSSKNQDPSIAIPNLLNVPLPTQFSFIFGIGRQDLRPAINLKNPLIQIGLEARLHRHFALGIRCMQTLPCNSIIFLTGGKKQTIVASPAERKIEEEGGVIIFLWTFKISLF